MTSLDWQESDRVLAGIMTAFGSPTGGVQIGGYGEFDGVLLEAFKRPRIQGTFTGDRLNAWNVIWGTGRADLAIENSYVFVSNATVAAGDSEIRADGQFSLGYPRRDGGDEIDARIRVTGRPLVDLRHAFNLDDYPIEGTVSGEYQLYGKYLTPFGFGRLQIEKGTAYGETFDTATSSLRFEGTGVRLDTIDIKKSTGSVTGAAYVGWDGNYSFNADGARIPVESLVSVSFPRAPLSGRLQFNATGAGTFDDPRYDVKLAVDDLFAGDEGIGQLSGRLNLRGESADARSRSSIATSRRLRIRPDRPHRRDGCRDDGTVPRDLARPLRPLFRATAVAVYDRHCRRHDARRRRARQPRPTRRRREGGAARPQALRLPRAQRRTDRVGARPEHPRDRALPPRRRGDAAAAHR